jgi:hypothetical protein
MKASNFESLYKLCERWEEEDRKDLQGTNDFICLLRRIESHASLRYRDYGPFKEEANDFLERLRRWICQINDERMMKAMLQFVPWIMYLDQREMRALYRDAFRRIIVPFFIPQHDFSTALSENYEIEIRRKLQTIHFYSITESFNFKEFENVNSLTGLQKGVVLGERLNGIAAQIERSKHADAIVVVEDVVGTGKQAARVLDRVRSRLGEGVRILFVPLVALEAAVKFDSPLQKISNLTTNAATVISPRFCLTDDGHEHEPEIYKRMRSIVKFTESRVTEKLNEIDDPPDNCFGYGGVGAVLVTHQNAPNNTLPLLHHEAPEWAALFRRLHHSYGGSNE